MVLSGSKGFFKKKNKCKTGKYYKTGFGHNSILCCRNYNVSSNINIISIFGIKSDYKSNFTINYHIYYINYLNYKAFI